MEVGKSDAPGRALGLTECGGRSGGRPTFSGQPGPACQSGGQVGTGRGLPGKEYLDVAGISACRREETEITIPTEETTRLGRGAAAPRTVLLLVLFLLFLLRLLRFLLFFS